MGCLHIEDVPEELGDELARIARRQHDSVSHVVIALLRRALLSPEARQRRLFPRTRSLPTAPDHGKS
jgi:signal transduction histidine kinase